MKKAFTLAEVLITLGIIGVVAALTMPALINHYKKKTYVTGLQKAYSILNQNFKLVLVESDCTDLKTMGWGESLESIDGKTFTDANKRNMYLVYKKFNGAQWLDECVYKDYYSSVDNSLHNENTNLCSSGGFFSADGMLYAMNGSNIFVDVNGKDKGPNHLGRDIFQFYIDPAKSIVYGRNGWELNKGYCMTSNAGQAVWGSYCTKRVLDEGAMNY